MNLIKTTLKTLGATATGALLLGGVAVADMSGMSAEEVAAELQQQIALIPEFAGGSTIDVNADEGRVVLSGFVEDLQTQRAIDELLENTEGLDQDMVDNNIIMQ